MNYVHTDGGRAAAGYKGKAGDCFTRALAIATGTPYGTAWALVAAMSRQSPGKGVFIAEAKTIMASLGWKWTATMKIGSGCQTHLRGDELPSGRIIVRVSKHYVAVINGVAHDDHDSTRDGKRCVYGYWSKA